MWALTWPLGRGQGHHLRWGYTGRVFSSLLTFWAPTPFCRSKEPCWDLPVFTCLIFRHWWSEPCPQHWEAWNSSRLLVAKMFLLFSGSQPGQIIIQVVSVGAWASMHSLIWSLMNTCGLRAPGSNIPTGLVYYREWTYTRMDINL